MRKKGNWVWIHYTDATDPLHRDECFLHSEFWLQQASTADWYQCHWSLHHGISWDWSMRNHRKRREGKSKDLPSFFLSFRDFLHAHTCNTLSLSLSRSACTSRFQVLLNFRLGEICRQKRINSPLVQWCSKFWCFSLIHLLLFVCEVLK